MLSYKVLFYLAIIWIGAYAQGNLIALGVPKLWSVEPRIYENIKIELLKFPEVKNIYSCGSARVLVFNTNFISSEEEKQFLVKVEKILSPFRIYRKEWNESKLSECKELK